MPLPWHFSGHYRRIITGVTSELVVFDQWDCTNFYYPFRPSYAGNKEFDCTFIPSKLLKHSRPSFVYKPVRYRAYPHNLLLCPVATINEYVKRRESMNVQCDEFIITHGKPHKPAHSETMSRWLKEVMSESGVDVKIFKPHSCRSASTSAAIRGGIPVATILQQGNWSNVKTFSRYYNRDIPTEMDFTTVVIESKQN